MTKSIVCHSCQKWLFDSRSFSGLAYKLELVSKTVSFAPSNEQYYIFTIRPTTYNLLNLLIVTNTTAMLFYIH